VVEAAHVVSAASRPVKSLPGRTLRWLADRSVGTTATAALENYLPPGGFVPAHRHEVEELLVCLAGRGEFHIDGCAHSICEGDTVIIPARRVHGFRNLGEGRMRVLAVFPTAEPDVTWEDPAYATNWSRSKEG
jgi:quercetin dioxygenase-like cupin family protein